jgi:hypothetical protein
MYCNKCGQEIDPNVGYCKSCEQNETFFETNENVGQTFEQPQQPNYDAPQTPPVQPGDRKFGFKKALASTILGVLGYFVMAIAMGIGMGFAEQATLMEAFELEGFAVIGIVLTAFVLVIGAVLTVLSLVFGIKSIIAFVKRKREGYVKPIPTLILGIVGTASAATALLYGAVALLFLFLLFAFL